MSGQWAVDKGHGQGGVWTEGGVHLSPEIATAAVGAHPTGRHSCFFFISGNTVRVESIRGPERRLSSIGESGFTGYRIA